MTAIFDTHAHYDDDAFNDDREQLLAALPGQGIARVVDVGASLASCRKVLELMEQYDYIYGAIGVHPSETAELTEESYSWLKEQCQKEKCLAVGEIGLDYYWPEPDHETQKKWFLRQLELAREIKKPVIIHSRDAAKIRDKIETLLEAHYREIFEKWLETERIVCKPSFRLPLAIHPTTHTDIYARSLYTAEDGDMNKLEQKLVVELTALPNVRWWHRNIARQGFSINGFIKHYPDILIMTQSGKLICAETKGDHLKNGDSREKIALGQAWRTAAGKDFRYYMVFENEENLLPGAMSMSQFIDTVKAL